MFTEVNFIFFISNLIMIRFDNSVIYYGLVFGLFSMKRNMHMDIFFKIIANTVLNIDLYASESKARS
jgi:hypothetical protein